MFINFILSWVNTYTYSFYFIFILTNIVNIILNDNKKIEIKILECNIEFHKIEKLDKYIFETIDEERKNNIYKEQINDVYINYMSGTPQSKLSLQF